VKYSQEPQRKTMAKQQARSSKGKKGPLLQSLGGIRGGGEKKKPFGRFGGAGGKNWNAASTEIRRGILVEQNGAAELQSE